MITVIKVSEASEKTVYIRGFETLSELKRYFSDVCMNAMHPYTPVCNVEKDEDCPGNFIVHWMYSDKLSDNYPYTVYKALLAIEKNTVSEKTTSERLQELYDSAMSLGEAIWEDDYIESNLRFDCVIDLIRRLANQLDVTIININDDISRMKKRRRTNGRRN